MALAMEVGLGPGCIVANGNPAPLPKMGQIPPIFGPSLLHGQTAGYIKMPLGMEVGLSLADLVLDGVPDPSPKRGRSPSQFSAHVYCGQAAGAWVHQDATWYGAGRQPKRHCVAWGPSSRPKRAQPPIFGPCLLWLNGCMHHYATWYAGRPQPRRHCVRCGPSFPSLKGHTPNFRPNGWKD